MVGEGGCRDVVRGAVGLGAGMRYDEGKEEGSCVSGVALA